jgi:hypothetical protein
LWTKPPVTTLYGIIRTWTSVLITGIIEALRRYLVRSLIHP